MSEIGTF